MRKIAVRAALIAVVSVALISTAASFAEESKTGVSNFNENRSCSETRVNLEIAFPCKKGIIKQALMELADGSSHVIEYELIGGHAVFEGDILLHVDQNGTARAAKHFDLFYNKSTGRQLSAFRWPGAVVPYTIDPGLPNQQRVTDAIAHWESNTRIDFVWRSSQSSYVTFRKNSGCSSNVGRQGGQQFINLADGCSTGNAIHEIGHAIGLWHEHTRSDRDNNVIIYWDNIENGKSHNFETYIARGEDGFDLGSHDFGSIMHYSSYAFSRNGLPTITRLNGSTFFAQRQSLSAGDIAGVDYMYPIPPLNATVSGPSSRNSNQSGTWTVSVSGGVPPYTYSWFKSSSNGITELGNGTSATTSDTTSFNIVCDVVDLEGRFATDYIFVDVDGDSGFPLPF